MTLPEFIINQNRPGLFWKLINVNLLPTEALERISLNNELPTITMQLCQKGWWKLVERVLPLVSYENVKIVFKIKKLYVNNKNQNTFDVCRQQAQNNVLTSIWGFQEALFKEEKRFKTEKDEHTKKRIDQEIENSKLKRLTIPMIHDEALKDCFEVLNIPDNSDLEEVYNAYQRYHPDNGGNAEKFKKVSAAYEYLKEKVTHFVMFRPHWIHIQNKKSYDYFF